MKSKKMIKLIFILYVIVLVACEENFEKSLVQMIKKAGHMVETFRVHTADGYILTAFRLPSKLANPKIVLLMHGILSSAADFVIGGNNASLAYLLAENGYDVWLANARGNIFSQTHETLDKRTSEFWNFSFHEIGIYDVPGIIDFALKKRNGTSLTYIGYSQGTTALFVLLSMRPEYNSKISTAYLMAPVAYIRFPSHYEEAASSFLKPFPNVLSSSQIYEIYPINTKTRKMVSNFCKNEPGLSTCRSICMEIAGYSPNQYNEDLMPKIYQFFPASSGYKQFVHYGQIINANGRFIRFDYERETNLKLYNQPLPPAYSLSNINTKLYFLYGSNDPIANTKDVEYLISKLQTSVVGVTKINDWNHIDFIFGKDSQSKVNNVILNQMKSVH